jgi:hypothetical protein
MLVPDLVSATKLHQARQGLALILLGYPIQLFLRFAGERPAELTILTLLQLPVFYFHVLSHSSWYVS